MKYLILLIITFGILSASSQEQMAKGNECKNKRDFTNAVVHYSQACELGDKKGCLYSAIIYKKGLGVAKNPIVENGYFFESCTKNEGIGCFSLGMNFIGAKGVKNDIEIAKTFFKKSCKLNFDKGCQMLNMVDDFSF